MFAGRLWIYRWLGIIQQKCFQPIWANDQAANSHSWPQSGISPKVDTLGYLICHIWWWLSISNSTHQTEQALPHVLFFTWRQNANTLSKQIWHWCSVFWWFHCFDELSSGVIPDWLVVSICCFKYYCIFDYICIFKHRNGIMIPKKTVTCLSFFQMAQPLEGQSPLQTRWFTPRTKVSSIFEKKS